MKKLIYFAYGSNLLTERLRARCPSAQPVGIAVAPGYRLIFSKQSVDKSGKATLEKTVKPEQKAYGVLFKIETDDHLALDRAEGKGNGYDRIENFSVTSLHDTIQAEVMTYLASADAIDPMLKPFDWYKDLVIGGAVQHKLPKLYIASLRAFTSIIDPKPDRKSRKDAIAALKLASLSGSNG